MNAELRRIGDWLKAHYDRIITLAILIALLMSLLSLGVRVGMKQREQTRFLLELGALKPVYPMAAPVDCTLFETGQRALTNPPAIGPWPNRRMMTPEIRVSCVDCGRPIPFNATNCPFCSAAQPLDTITLDKDQDGMPDDWEKKYDFNPLDASDAAKDADGDGFSNLEECQFATDPRDSKEFPPPSAKLRVAKIKPLPFMLIFKGVSEFGPRTNRFKVFQLNLGMRADRSFLARMGEEVQGYRLTGYEKKTRMEKLRGVPREVDESVLTLKKGDKIVALIKNKEVPEQQYEVTFVYLVDNSERVVKVGEDFEIKGLRYRVKDVDTKDTRALVEDISAGEKRWIGQQHQAEPLAPAGGGA